MASVTLWFGNLTEQEMEFGPRCWALDTQPGFTCWTHDVQVLVRRFAGKRVLITIEEILPLRASIETEAQEPVPDQNVDPSRRDP